MVQQKVKESPQRDSKFTLHCNHGDTSKKIEWQQIHQYDKPEYRHAQHKQFAATNPEEETDFYVSGKQ